MKFYVLGAYLLVLLPLIFTKVLFENTIVNKSYQIPVYASFVIIAWFGMQSISLILFEVDVPSLIFYTNEIFNIEGESDYKFYGLSTSSFSFIPYLPKALGEGLFMPLIWKKYSLLMMLESIFNIIILLISLIAIVFTIKWKLKINDQAKIIMFYIIINAVVFGFSSPNWGTLSRYKIYYTPFYYFLLAYVLLNRNIAGIIIDKVQRFRLF